LSIADVRPDPAHDAAGAAARFAVLAERDGPQILPEGRSRFYSAPGAARGALAVVLLHGLTNAPQQWVPFAEDLHARGHAVVVPRFPGHGNVDRRGTALRAVRAADFLRTASEAVDIAAGAGERVVVAGLSIGGAMAAWLAQRRPDVARSVPIVPLFGVAKLGSTANAGLARGLLALPCFMIPWDPRGDPNESPPYAYPKFPTHALAECLRIGLDVYRSANDLRPAGSTAFLLNANEPACNNALALKVAAGFGRGRAGSCDTVRMEGLPVNHDVIDPNNPNARIDVVYPRVRALIEG
jgi:pimeloyl-ACP methyl ester carboxylesterase